MYQSTVAFPDLNRLLSDPETPAEELRQALQSLLQDNLSVSLKTLTYTERDALAGVLQVMDGQPDTIVVTSRVADSKGLTRSVVVSTLRKLASAGIVQTRSLGMKGTWIRVINPELWDWYDQWLATGA